MEGLSLPQDVWASAGRLTGWGLESSQDSFTPCLVADAGRQLEAWVPFRVDSRYELVGGPSQHGGWLPQSNHPQKRELRVEADPFL